MSGKFINTKQTSAINSLVSGFKDHIINNNFYKFNDKKATIIVYYNINTKLSTLDKSLLLEYAPSGKDSPVLFNKINDLYIYGFEKINLNMDTGEFGIEADEIVGDAIILPNTIQPIPGDYFTVPYIKEDLLFKVIDVQFDTLDNGANIYKIQYKLVATSSELIESFNIAEEFNMLIENVGTNSSPIIQKSSYDELYNIDQVLTKLRLFYRDLFYNDRIQSFSYTHNCNNVYDPYMIEFLERTGVANSIVYSGSDYIHVVQQIRLWKEFNLEYEFTIYNALEKCNKDMILSCNNSPIPECIIDTTTIFNTRYEEYYYMNYAKVQYEPPDGFNYKVNILDTELISNILKKVYSKDPLWNILIKYFNNDSDLSSEVATINDGIHISDSKDNFYIIPLVIFCLEQRAKTLTS